MDATPIIIHGWTDAQAAIAHDSGVILRSAPGAALYAGVLWWRELIAALRSKTGWRGLALLDCGGEAAYAVEAIHCGVTGLILDAACPLFDEVASLARQAGGELWEARNGALRRPDSSSAGPKTTATPS